MGHRRKRRWTGYRHIKCKMYLRNDFGFECAYCRMREEDNGILGEDGFEKDHFIPRSSKVDEKLDAYDNMIYACAKCNGNKADKNVNLLLDPCKDDIYQGENPHVKNLGKEGDYQLIGNTQEGQQYINALQLNSRFYRQMRENQEKNRIYKEQLNELVQEMSELRSVSEEIRQKVRRLVYNGYRIERGDRQSFAFKCGCSKAGIAFQQVLDILEQRSIAYELLFADKDIDVRLQYCGRNYLCEIVLNETAQQLVSGIRMKSEQREAWIAEKGNYGVLYYYMKTGRLDLYCINSEGNYQLECLQDNNTENNFTEAKQ